MKQHSDLLARRLGAEPGLAAAVTDSTSRISHSDLYNNQSSSTEERITKTLFAMATTGTLLLSGTASAQEFPVYELSGFPISPHQISIMVTTANLKEQSPGTSLTMGGMPASPLQILVLTPRPKSTDEAKLDRFIKNPDAVVPGNNMKPYGGLAWAGDRAKLTAFL